MKVEDYKRNVRDYREPMIFNLESMNLDECLAELGWTKRDLAKRFGLHRNTISRWKEPPAAVMAYLKLRIRVQRLLDD